MRHWIARALASETTFTIIAVVSFVTILTPVWLQGIRDTIQVTVTGRSLPKPREFPTCSRCGRSEYAVGRCLHCARPEPFTH